MFYDESMSSAFIAMGHAETPKSEVSTPSMTWKRVEVQPVKYVKHILVLGHCSLFFTYLLLTPVHSDPRGNCYCYCRFPDEKPMLRLLREGLQSQST